jgi:hypothetical protein
VGERTVLDAKSNNNFHAINKKNNSLMFGMQSTPVHATKAEKEPTIKK